jgi:dolichol-phosphate mannosyltransferase
MPEKNRFVRGMVSWVGFQQEAFPYDRDPRLAGESKYPLRRMLSLAADAITSFSIKPLKISYYLTLLFGSLAFLSAGAAGFLWMAGSSSATIWVILAMLCFFNSLQMGVIAVQGEYLGRLYEEGKHRPLFIVERTVNLDPKSADLSLERQAA